MGGRSSPQTPVPGRGCAPGVTGCSLPRPLAGDGTGDGARPPDGPPAGWGGPPRPPGAIEPAREDGVPSPGAAPVRSGAGRGAPPRRDGARARAGGFATAGRRPTGPRKASPKRRRRRGPPARRAEPSGRTARTPPVYLSTGSRTLELSLQSSFQLSLTVLIRYRARAAI